MSLTLTVHRGTHEIGGTCIEIHHTSGERLILDAGRPLDAPEGANGLVPVSLDCSRAATVLISHPHQDHWGVIDQLPASWPIWTGSRSAKLIAIPGELFRHPLTVHSLRGIAAPGGSTLDRFVSRRILTDHRRTMLTCCSSKRMGNEFCTRETFAGTDGNPCWWTG